MSFFDTDSCAFSELWDPYLYSDVSPLYSDSLMRTSESKDEEFGNLLCLRNSVVLRDRLMTDAALGGPRPIKSEHSYSLLASSPPPSPTKPEANPYTPSPDSSSDAVGSSAASTIPTVDFSNLDHKPLYMRGRIDDIDEEYFSTMSMKAATNRNESSPLASPSTLTMIFRKDELIPEDNESPDIKVEPISAPSSPCTPSQSGCDIVDEKPMVSRMSQNIQFIKSDLPDVSDSEEDDDYYQNMEVEECEMSCEREETTLHASRQGLPPTPPSSASSDSEGTASASCSPERRDSQTSTHVQNLRGLLSPRLYVTNGTHASRQPIHTPLISCQPKGSTGLLTLTEEEKRTLIAEGYPVPTKLPLTKQEEKSLKKVRRKIKNKISAQESRRKKKEYMDGLERRVTVLTNENSLYKDRLNALEDTNRELLKELQRLQILLQLQQS